MTKIQHINSNTPALFEDTIRAFQIIQALGKGALDIAVASCDTTQGTEQRILEIAEVMALNQDKPGEFAEYILRVKRPNKNGKKTPLVREGQVKRALIHWAGQSADLRKGRSRKEMAKFFQMAPTDSRIQQITKGIEVALYNGIGVRAGWLDGRFRILTAKQIERKQGQRQKRITGEVAGAEHDQQFQQARGATEVGHAAFTVSLFSELPEVSDALN